MIVVVGLPGVIVIVDSCGYVVTGGTSTGVSTTGGVVGASGDDTGGSTTTGGVTTGGVSSILAPSIILLISSPLGQAVGTMAECGTTCSISQGIP